MKYSTDRTEHALVIGFYQSPGITGAALMKIRRDGFRRSAAVHCAGTGEVRVDEHGIRAGYGALGAAVIGLLLGILVLLPPPVMEHPIAIPGLALQLAACALAGALAGWLVFRSLDARVDAAHLERFRRWMVRNETVVMVEVPAWKAARVLTILRAVEGEPPLTFAFHPSTTFDFEPEANLFRREAPSSQRLADKAARLAHSFSIEGGAKPSGHSLLLRLRESERILKWTDASLTMSAEAHHAFALSAEWLLDNAYLIQGQISEIRRSLPKNYYEQLPVIASGPQAGLPRVYRIATELVAECDGAVDAETIRNFLIAFQSVSPLNIGELWAVPLAAAAPGRMPALDGHPGGATPERERGGGFLGESSHHRRAAQSGAADGADGGAGPAASKADGAFCQRAGGASLR
jgi:uncharacterized membrane protein